MQNQESLTRLVELHKSIPGDKLERSIPRLIGIFEDVRPLNLKQEWQKAIAALCLVLACAVRENQQPSTLVKV